jgi:RNA polymerase sigma-70 factor, ECF subfamily
MHQDQTDTHARFYATIWPHAAMVLRSAQILVRHAADAEDLAQVVLMKAFKAMNQLTDGSDPRPWLLKILRNAGIDRLRSREGRDPMSSIERVGEIEDRSTTSELVRVSSDDPDALIEQISDQQVIDALAELPDEMRWALLLVDVEGMTQEDAAQVLEVAVGTIKSRTHRGRAMLRGALLPLAREYRLVK